MIHLESYIEAQRILCLKEYYENFSSTWKCILDFYLKKVGGKYLLQCNFQIPKLPTPIEALLYYKHCLHEQAWSSLKPPCAENRKIEEHILWNNKIILIENKTTYCQKFVNKGIRRINDLLSTNGGFHTMDDILSKGLKMSDVFLVMSIIYACEKN